MPSCARTTRLTCSARVGSTHAARPPFTACRSIACVAMIWLCAERSAAATYPRAQDQSVRVCAPRWVRRDGARRRCVGTSAACWRWCADALFRANREKSLAAHSRTSADLVLATPDLHPFLSMLEDERSGCSARCVAYGGCLRRGGGIAENRVSVRSGCEWVGCRKCDFFCFSRVVRVP